MIPAESSSGLDFSTAGRVSLSSGLSLAERAAGESVACLEEAGKAA